MPRDENGSLIDVKRYASNSYKDHASRLGTDDFSEESWKEIFAEYEKKEEKRTLTFSKLVHYMEEPDNKVYTDNGQFCKERYGKALDSSKNWLKAVLKKEIPDGKATIETEEDVKLVHYNTYVEQMN